MLRYGADGTLIAPHWISVPWWPLLFKAKGKFRKEICAFLIIPQCINMLILAVTGLTMFGSEKLRLFLWCTSMALSPRPVAQSCSNSSSYTSIFKSLKELSVYCIFQGSKSLLGEFKKYQSTFLDG